MFCTKCGNKLEENASFCTKCGSPVEIADLEKTVQMPAAPAPVAPAPVAPAPAAAPVATPVVPAASPAPAAAAQAAQSEKKSGLSPVAIGGIAALIVAILVVVLLVANPFGGKDDSGEADNGGQTEATSHSSEVTMKLPRVDCSNFPKVVAYVVVAPADGEELDNFDSSMFVVTEEDGDGNSYTNKVSDCSSLSKDELSDLGISKKDSELAYAVSFKSGCSDETAERTLTISCSEESGYEGSAHTGVTPKAASSEDEPAKEEESKQQEEKPTTVVVVVEHDGGVRDEVHQAQSGYILPDSDTYLYSYSELSGYNTWELYLARNEIFARHGRGFKNADLRNYFNSCSWYYESYSPSEFDAIESSSGILNSVEKKNAEMIKSVERDKGSSYLN